MEPNELASVVHDVTAALEHEGNVRAVFGEPMRLDTKTIIPVATIGVGGGGGGVRALGAAVASMRRWLGPRASQTTPAQTLAGGAGGGFNVRPVGFLHEDDGRVVFTPIDDGGRVRPGSRPR